ncbi:MAG: radical SAM protein [Candidatus Edwardsbacteria bacterium]
MPQCICCKKESPLISSRIGVCLDCIHNRFSEVKQHLGEVHAQTRRGFQLPEIPPKDIQGVKCNLCVNECQIGEGKKGYCGLRESKGGKLFSLDGLLDWYYDPLPTNCVADWVCEGSKEIGFKNLAVFYGACSFDCLFCQNWHYKEYISRPRRTTPEESAEKVDDKTACICYFGGDPTPQLSHAIKTSELALEKTKGRTLRICWETNGTMNPSYLDRMAELSYNSNGCIKFDLKTFNENLNIALCGVTNKRTLENFASLVSLHKKRRNPPFLIASTLLIPGYIDREEVRNIVQFIASLDEEIPYSLLGFYPHFMMNDLPRTSRLQAEECLKAAKDVGLKRVHIGNLHLLT